MHSRRVHFATNAKTGWEESVIDDPLDLSELKTQIKNQRPFKNYFQ